MLLTAEGDGERDLIQSRMEEVRASHILIKHEGSRRKASWKDPDGRVISSTTREVAAARLESLREEVVSGRAHFADLASVHSDCSSAKRGGDLGTDVVLVLTGFVLMLLPF